MSPYHDVEVSIETVPTEQGGNSLPLTSGARPQFYYEGQDWDCELHLIDQAEARPGQLVRAHVAFASPHEHAKRLRPGSAFLIRYGHKTVGFGTVTRLVDLADPVKAARAATA